MKYYLFAITVFLLSSCTHVNKITHYEFEQKKFLFEYNEAGENGMTRVHLQEDTTQAKTDSKRTNKGAKAGEIISETIGTGMIKSTTETKLRNAASEINFQELINEEIKTALIKYVKATPVNDLNADYDYIVTTTLLEYSINSNSQGSTLDLKLQSEITDRVSAGIVWKDLQIKSISLNFSSSQSVAKSTGSQSLGNAAQMTELSLISEATIKQALINATKSATKGLTETLINDIRISKEPK